MWTNGDDFNDDGERVRLYQPIAYSSGRTLSQDDPTVSFIGGSTTSCPTAFCSNCHASMEHLVQLHIPNQKRTYHVLGCNQAKCVNALFAAPGQSKFCGGGGGVFWGQRQTVEEETMVPTTSTTTTPMRTQAAPVPETKPDTNDWMVDSDDDDDDDDDDDLEQQVAAMELKASEGKPKSKSKNSHKKKKKPSTQTTGSHLPCFELHSLLEPPGFKQPKHNDDDDDDDDDDYIGTNLGAGSSSDAKIQQMLAKYMAEEEDEEILAALRGATSGGGGGTSREKDVRLKASDRALLAFTDRIKRSPRQVLRYAPNGIPLWSIPRPQGSSGHPPKGKKSKVNFQASETNTNNEATMAIPPCSCGAERRFEFQLMPSLLHVLEVDKHATRNHQTDDLDVIMSTDYGGMNWGSIAVYTCTQQPDCGCAEDYLVVQASVDETPCKRAVADAPVFIDEGQIFDPLTNDGVALEGCNYDDDEEDEGTVVDESDLVFTLDG